MAENNEEPQNDEIDDLDGETEQKKSKKKLIIIIVALLLGGGGAGAFFTGALDSMLGGGDKHSEELAEEDSEENADGETGDTDNKEEAGSPKKDLDHFAEQEKLTSMVFYDLPEFLVNLNTGGRKTSFLKVTVTLELASQEVSKKVTDIKPRIINDFNTYMRELRASDLHGSAGIYRLREELLMRVNKAMYPLKVNDILFKEIIVQ